MFWLSFTIFGSLIGQNEFLINFIHFNHMIKFLISGPIVKT